MVFFQQKECQIQLGSVWLISEESNRVTPFSFLEPFFILAFSSKLNMSAFPYQLLNSFSTFAPLLVQLSIFCAKGRAPWD